MFNLRASIFAAVTAFILSLMIGLLSRTAMPQLLVRPVIFAIIFFVAATLIYFLVNRFLPELVPGETREDETTDFLPGSHLDITEGDSADFPEASPSAAGQLFMGAQADDSEEGLGNISDIHTKNAGQGMAGMDQNTKDEYNGEGKLEELSDSDEFVPWDPLAGSGGPMAVGEDIRPVNRQDEAPPSGGKSTVPDAPFLGSPGSEDFFPDLDSMAGAFIPSSSGGGSDAGEYPGSVSSSKRSRRNDAPAWSEDFNAKDMAAGLRTVLNKEKEG